ncbi:MAG: hypothetical protein HZB16_13025 [Armatimonadetes bacterium]|nr:hypothetical protein [Armatimonadota bacterium]
MSVPRPVLLVLASLLLYPGLARAAEEAALYREKFDSDAGGWVDFDPNAAALTSQRAVAHEGGALQCRYDVKEKGAPHVIGKAELPALTGARSFRFWLATSHDAIMALLVQEPGGARYVSAFPSFAGRWQHVEISYDRLRLSDDTTDDNARLDLDKPAGLALADLSSMLPLAKQPPGARVLWLDDFQIDTDDAPTAYSSKHELPYLLDDFQADYVTWLALSGSLTQDAVAKALVWKYPAQTPAGSLPAAISILGQLPADGAGNVAITLSSLQARNVAFSLQEENRATRPERNFISTAQLKGGGQKETLVLPITKFQLDEKDKPKGDGPLQLGLVNRLSLIDVDVLMGQAQGENTITITEVLLTK